MAGWTVTLSKDQVSFMTYAVRDEVKRRTKSIERAEAARARGDKVQHNVLDAHYAALGTAKTLLADLRLAATQGP